MAQLRRTIIFNEPNQQNTNNGMVIRKTEEKDFSANNTTTSIYDTSAPSNEAANTTMPKANQPRKNPEEDYSKGLQEEIHETSEEGQRNVAELGRVEGTEEAVKEAVAAQEMYKTKLDDLVDSSKHILYRMKTVFPFDLFPDEITIDPIKVTIAYHEFFGSGQIRIVMIEDISDVIAGTTPFFSSIKIIHNKDKTPITIQPLHKQDALKAVSILQGLLLTHKQKIDITKLPVQDTTTQIETLGTSQVGL